MSMASFQLLLKRAIDFKFIIMERVAFTAPVGGDSKRLDNVEILPTGMQLCTFYGLADLGTQDSHKFGPKHKCQLAFEFPQEMRQFYEGDDLKPCAVFTDETLSMAPKSNLRKNYIEAMVGRKLTEDEAKVFEIDKLLGNHYVATIAHSPDGKYANITSITPLTDKNRLMFGLQENSVQQINESFFFHLSQGFNSENFKALPRFVREKIKGSAEGVMHVRNGGTFAEPDASDYQNSGNSNAGKKIKMLPNAKFTYQQYKEADWTDQMLVDNNEAVWETAVSAPQPQAGPSAPSPQAPQPAQPASQPESQPAPPAVTPSAPTAPKEKKLIVKNGSALEDWIKQGWTPEMMIKEGHAYYEEQ